jgi:hypothetical protein
MSLCPDCALPYPRSAGDPVAQHYWGHYNRAPLTADIA